MDWQLKLDPSNLLAVRLIEIKVLTSDFLKKIKWCNSEPVFKKLSIICRGLIEVETRFEI